MKMQALDGLRDVERLHHGQSGRGLMGET